MKNPNSDLLEQLASWYANLSPKWQHIIDRNCQIQAAGETWADIHQLADSYLKSSSTIYKKLLGKAYSPTIPPAINLQNLHFIYAPNANVRDVPDLSLLTSLKYIDCSQNHISTLNLSGCANLIELHCWENQIEVLDLKDCPKIIHVTCGANQIEILELSNCPELTKLWCFGNKIKTLELSKCPELTSLYAYENKLSVLDVRIAQS